jgi:hypothetical protein
MIASRYSQPTLLRHCVYEVTGLERLDMNQAITPSGLDSQLTSDAAISFGVSTGESFFNNTLRIMPFQHTTRRLLRGRNNSHPSLLQTQLERRLAMTNVCTSGLGEFQ